MARDATPRESRPVLPLAALAFALGVPLTYGLQRALETASGAPSDPRTVLMSLHTAYYWRAGVSFWFGVVIAIVVHALGSRIDPTRAARTARVLGVLVALGFALCAYWLP